MRATRGNEIRVHTSLGLGLTKTLSSPFEGHPPPHDASACLSQAENFKHLWCSGNHFLVHIGQGAPFAGEFLAGIFFLPCFAAGQYPWLWQDL